MSLSDKGSDLFVLGLVKVGDKVEFIATKLDGAFVVTDLQVSRQPGETQFKPATPQSPLRAGRFPTPPFRPIANPVLRADLYMATRAAELSAVVANFVDLARKLGA